MAAVAPLEDPDKDKPPYVTQGLIAGALAGFLFALISAGLTFPFAGMTMKSDMAVAVLCVLAGVTFLCSGVLIGLTMGLTRDFSREGGAWAIYPRMVIIIIGGIALFGPHVGAASGFMLTGGMSYRVGYFQRMLWGASWDLG